MENVYANLYVSKRHATPVLSKKVFRSELPYGMVKFRQSVCVHGEFAKHHISPKKVEIISSVLTSDT